jgi:hypothetical protein
MKMDPEKELPLKPYLLGDLNPDDQERIERRLMVDSEVFEELGWTEDELIDDYLEGALTRRDKEKFESFFLSAPERQRKLGFAKTLKRYVAENELKEDRWAAGRKIRQSFWQIPAPVLQGALAASLLLIIAGGSWSALRITELQKAIKQAETRESQGQSVMQNRNSELTSALEREQARVKNLEQETARLRNGNTQRPSSLLPGQLQSTLIAVTLSPGLLRDLGGSQKFSIPPGTNLAQLDLKMEPQDYPQYQLALQRVDGGKTWIQIAPKTESGAQSRSLRLIVPANVLRPDDYVLKLSGITAAGDLEDIGKYYFRVTPK